MKFLLPIAFACGLLCSVLGCGQAPIPQAKSELPPDEQLRERIDHVLDYTYANRHLSTSDQAAWQVVHGALCFGRDFQIYHDGQLVNAVDYLLAGGALRGWNLRPGDHGLEAILESGSKTGQGHEDQWLGYLSQCGLPADTKIVVGGREYTFRDLISQAQWDIYEGMEATWTLMAFSTYLPLDASWTAKDGTTWTIPRMVAMEANQDLGDSACGGTHRLYGLTVALKRYQAEGGKLPDAEGVWTKADDVIQQAIATVREFQQPDGSLSSNYFIRPSSTADISVRLGTTGHTLEFLMAALPDDQLQQPWVTRAVASLVDAFEKTERFDLECGGLYHAARGLELYRTRRFGPRKHPAPAQVGLTGTVPAK